MGTRVCSYMKELDGGMYESKGALKSKNWMGEYTKARVLLNQRIGWGNQGALI